MVCYYFVLFLLFFLNQIIKQYSQQIKNGPVNPSGPQNGVWKNKEIDCRVLIATKANTTEHFIRSSALLDTKSIHSLYARSHCSVHICPACTTTVRYALLLIHTTAVHHTTTLMNNESCNLETSCMSPTWAPSTCLTDLLWKREEKRRGRTKLIQPTTV